MKRRWGRPDWAGVTLSIAESNAKEVVNRLQGLYGPLLHPLDVNDVTMMCTAQDFSSNQVKDNERYHKHVWYGECNRVNLEEIKKRASRFFTDGRLMV